MTGESQPSAASGTAIVAAVFSLIVCGMLLWNYAGGKNTAPLNDPALLALKQALHHDPRNGALRDQIRELDARRRAAFFRQQQTSRSGAWLLAGGMAVFIVAANAAAIRRRDNPHPGPEPDTRAEWRRRTRLSQLAMVALGMLVGGAAVATVMWHGRGSGRCFAAALAPAPAAAPATTAPAWPARTLVLQNWPCFRGPQGDGIVADTNLSLSWDVKTGAGIAWQAPGALSGKSSPVVWGNRVFVTGADAQNRRVACYDAGTGRRLWEKAIPGSPGNAAGIPKVSEDSGYAAPTPATDGTRVYAIFANGDIAAFDFAGNAVWSRNLGLPESQYGYAAS